jgi:diguanylate cyclase (GGDEF)-like protein
MKRIAAPHNITGALEHKSPRSLGALAVALFLGATLLRFYSSPEFSFSFLYLIPVSFAAWFLSTGSGLFMSLASTCALVIFDLEIPGRYRSREIAFWDLVMNLGIFFFFVYVLGEVKSLYRREQEQSHHDPLTGLLNRRGFSEALDLEAERMRRTERPLTVAYLDLDNFKQVNDQHGHAAGDALLRTVSRAMLANIRGMDVVARLGGDEFCLLLPESGGDAAHAAVGKLEQRLHEEVAAAGWPVTFSIGAVTFETAENSADQMMERADQLMYRAKQGGKNRTEFANVTGQRQPQAG